MLTITKLPAAISSVLSLFLLMSVPSHAQTIGSWPSQLTNGDRNDGLTIKVSQPVKAKPKILRIVFPFKAEEATGEKAVEKLAGHMKTIRDALSELDANPAAIEFAEMETNPSNAMQSMVVSMANPAANVWMNAMEPPIAFPAQAAIPAQRIVQGIQIAAAPMFANVRGIPNPMPRDSARTLPTVVIASCYVSADWNLEGKMPAEIASLKPRLLAAIAKRNLDGKELFHKFTVEQEDEIFEITKIDIRNGDARSIFATPIPAPRVFFVASVPESDYNVALKSAFQSAQKLATQIAVAGNMKLGKMESVNIQLVTRPQQVSSYTATPAAYNQFSPNGFPSNSNTVFQSDWEPAITPGDVRVDNLNQLQQILGLTARYTIE